MAKYSVSYMVVYNEVVEADSPEEASCPYDVDGFAAVTNLDTNEYYEV